MGLPWVRLDANIATHDKTLKLLGCRGGKNAMLAYIFALAWSGGQATDGHIPAVALPMLHATPADARLLEDVGLFDPDPEGNGWWIRNWDRRQEAHEITEAKREKARLAGRKSGCKRAGHAPDCLCWKNISAPIRLVRQ